MADRIALPASLMLAAVLAGCASSSRVPLDTPAPSSTASAQTPSGSAPFPINQGTEWVAPVVNATPVRADGSSPPVTNFQPVPGAPTAPASATVAVAPSSGPSGTLGRNAAGAPLPPPGSAAAAAASGEVAAPGVWIQLGSFADRLGADRMAAQAAERVPSLSNNLRVFNEGGMHRLQVGPFASREAASGAVAQLRSGLGVSPFMVQRP